MKMFVMQFEMQGKYIGLNSYTYELQPDHGY